MKYNDKVGDSMQRYFGITKNETTISLNPEDFNHIKNVMRFKRGDKINVVYDSKVFVCELLPSLEECTIIEELEYFDQGYTIRLFMPILQEEKTDLILQKCTELGVREFTPVNMERCKYKIDESKKEKKILRWKKICKEASEQSEKNYIPKVNEIVNFKNIDSEADKLIICSLEKNKAIDIKTAFKNINKNDIINIVFGPEGGLSNKEEETLVEKGYERVNFGSCVLRTETAPLYISSVIKYIYSGE